MTVFQKAVLHASNFLSTATGIAFAWFRYGPKPADEWAAVPRHPAEPWALAAHLLVVPFLVFAIGTLWGTHIGPKLKSPLRKKWVSGISMLSTASAMVLSGYALQISVDADWRKGWAIAHWVSSGIWVLVFLLHSEIVLKWARSIRGAVDQTLNRKCITSPSRTT